MLKTIFPKLFISLKKTILTSYPRIFQMKLINYPPKSGSCAAEIESSEIFENSSVILVF